MSFYYCTYDEEEPDEEPDDDSDWLDWVDSVLEAQDNAGDDYQYDAHVDAYWRQAF